MSSYAIDLVGDAFGLSEPSARLILTLLLAYPIAAVYRFLVAKHSAAVQHCFSAACGMWLVFILIGMDIWHSLLDILLVYEVLLACGGTPLALTLVWCITLGHLLLGYVAGLVYNEEFEINWLLPHCLIVFKLIGLATDMCDGRRSLSKSENREDNNDTVQSMPPLMEVLGYSFFFGSVIVGPPICFLQYRKLVQGRLFDSKKMPSFFVPAVRQMVTTIPFAALYVTIGKALPIKYLTTDEYAERHLLEKLGMMMISTKGVLWRYTTVWLLAEGACIMTGISFKSVDDRGNVDWSGVRNVNITKFETTTTLQGVIESFSMGTSSWTAKYVFKRLKWLGNKNASHIITMVFLAVWHGLWPGYLICFVSEFLSVKAERQLISVLKSVFGSSFSDLPLLLRPPLWLCAYLLKNSIFLYFVTVFVLLNFNDCWKFMVAVHFYGHVVVLLWLLVYPVYCMVTGSGKVKQH